VGRAYAAAAGQIVAGEELIFGANPLLAIAGGFEFVLNRGGLEGPPATGAPGEIIPYSVQAPVSMADQMAAFESGSVDPYPFGTESIYAPAQQIYPPGEPLPPFQFDPKPGGVPPSQPGFDVVPYEPVKPPAGNRPYEILPPVEPPGVGEGGWRFWNPGALLRIPGLIGLGALLWEGWPNELGSGELPPGTYPYGMGPPPDLVVKPELPAEVGGPYSDALPSLGDLQRSLEAGNAAEAQRAAQRAIQQASTPAVAPTTAARLWPWIGLGLGVAGLAGRSSSSSPVPQYSLGVADALTVGNVAAQSSGAPFPFGAGGWGTSTSTGECTPPKRGPRRKCLQRAPVKFSAGPKKGKAAGSKCLRFSARKSA
jgi:hypothetical protein